MKKLLALLMAAVILAGAAGCIKINITPASDDEEVQVETDEILGGWTRADSPVITDETRELLKKALEDLVGAEYTPVAYLGYQIVAGTNHRILCRISPVVPDAKETYAVVTIYEDLSGSAWITDVKDFEVETNLQEETLPGGWFEPETPEITEDAKTVFDQAMETLVGVDYVPVALLEQQVVAGMNYCYLCEATVVYPGAETTYALVYIYEDPEGNVSIQDIVRMTDEESSENDQEADMGNRIGIPNPFVNYETLAEAALAAGFELTAPESISGYDETIIQVMNNEMVQIIFLNGDSRVIVRKAAGSDDISGDYNEYSETQVVDVDGVSVTIKGNDGAVKLATWTDNGYTYAVVSDDAMAIDAMEALVSQVK